MRIYISLTGFAMVAAGPPPLNCTDDDYWYLGNIPIAEVSDCITHVDIYNWALCLSEWSVGESCTDALGALITSEGAACDVPCQNVTSPGCLICSGVIVIQQIAYLAPEAPFAMCGSDYDRAAIMNATWSDVVEAGAVSDLFFTVETLSDTCDYCMSWVAEHALHVEYCGPLCTDTESVDCYNCRNVWFASGVAWCSSQINNEQCIDADFESLQLMNPATVTTCLDTPVNGDGLVHCLTDGGTVNLTKACATTLEGGFDFFAYADCGDHCFVNNSVECYNCKGAIMVYQTIAYDSILNGSCGTEHDRGLIYNVSMVDLFNCAETERYAAATCIGTTADVSPPCYTCLTLRTHEARQQCAAHCDDDEESADCLECVNIGLMSAAAYCNAHPSGSVGIAGLSLFSFVAMLPSMLLLPTSLF